MNRSIAVVAFALLTLPASTPLQADDLWMTDLDAAKQVAAEQGQDLLILFTGTEWCGNCVIFEKDVLARPEFAAAAETFVLVKLEYPASHDMLPEEIREDYIHWNDHYGINAVPTVILTDPAGKPYAMTGAIGLGPEEYVAFLRELRKVHPRRDKALAKAAQAEGVAKAKYLDKALSALEEAFGDDYAEANKNPLLLFYREEIEQLLAIKADEVANLRAKYKKVLNAKSQREHMRAVFAELSKILREDGADAALRAIDQRLDKVATKSLRNRLRLSRLSLLRQEKQYEKAIAYAKELANDKSFPPKTRRRAIRQELADLYLMVGRVDEAAAVYDALIADVRDDPAAAWRFASFKANRLRSVGRLKEALQTWEDARQYVEPGTADWAYNELFRARVLLKLDRPKEAATVMEQMLAVEATSPSDRAIALVELAKAQGEAGQLEKAADAARRAGDALEKTVEAGRMDQATALMLLARAQGGAGLQEEARETARQLEKAGKKSVEAGQMRQTTALLNLMEAQGLAGLREEARDTSQQAEEALKQRVEAGKTEQVRALLSLVYAQNLAGLHELANETARRIEEILNEKLEAGEMSPGAATGVRAMLDGVFGKKG